MPFSRLISFFQSAPLYCAKLAANLKLAIAVLELVAALLTFFVALEAVLDFALEEIAAVLDFIAEEVVAVLDLAAVEVAAALDFTIVKMVAVLDFAAEETALVLDLTLVDIATLDFATEEAAGFELLIDVVLDCDFELLLDTVGAA
jgi:hypothetical protein